MKLYKLSGRVPLLSILYGTIAALIMSPLLAAAYAYFVVYTPALIASPILALGFGAFLSFSVEGAMVAGKCRNSLVIGLFILLSVAVAYCLHWGFWVIASMDELHLPVSFAMLMDPEGIFEFIELRNETGTMAIFGTQITGAFSYGLWLIEAMLIFGISAFIGFAPRNPFCEKCKAWCVDKDSERFFAMGSENELDEVLIAKGIHALDDLIVSGQLPSLGFDIWSCECGETQTIRSKKIEEKEPGKKWDPNPTPIGKHIAATRQDIDYLLSIKRPAILGENKLPSRARF